MYLGSQIMGASEFLADMMVKYPTLVFDLAIG